MYKDDSFRKYSIDVMERIYKDLGIKDIRINQFVSSGEQGQGADLAKMLPTLGMMYSSLPAQS